VGGDYYDRLGVSRDASQETIASAYREKLKETHPDVSDASDAQKRTKRLIEAKEVLTDEHERARYDRLGHEQYLADDSADHDSAATGQPRRERARGSKRSDDFFNQWVDETAATEAAPGDFFTGWGGNDTFADSATETAERRHRERTGKTHRERTGKGYGKETGRGARGWASNRGERTERSDGEWTGRGHRERTGGSHSAEAGTGHREPHGKRESTGEGGGVDDFFDWDATEDIGAEPGEATADETADSSQATGTAETTTTVGSAKTATATGGPGGAASRASDNSSVDWYQSTRDQSKQRNRSWDAMTKGIHGSWPGGAAETYAVRHDRDPAESTGLLSSDRVLFVFGFTFVIYPVLLFGALLPAFPLAVRIVVAAGALVVTAFLQSIPQIGLFVFGTWAILVPVLLGTVGIPILAFEGILLLTAVIFPFLFSLLTWVTVRPRSL